MADEITLDAPETRIERFLAAAAGVEGIKLDEPETRIERYLYMIAQGSGGSGGGPLVVTDTDGTLNKTWQEIHDAMLSGGAVVTRSVPFPRVLIVAGTDTQEDFNSYTLSVGYEGDMYEASSASGYPELIQ